MEVPECDGCELSHQTVGTTNFVVTVNWAGGGSTPGVCDPVTCGTIPCYFGRYQVIVTGTGAVQWRKDPPASGFEGEVAVAGVVKRKYGSAAFPIEYECGSGLHQAYFPDDLAGGGPVCTACE